MKIHPQTIVRGKTRISILVTLGYPSLVMVMVTLVFNSSCNVGWRKAIAVAREALEKSAIDNSSDEGMNKMAITFPIPIPISISIDRALPRGLDEHRPNIDQFQNLDAKQGYVREVSCRCCLAFEG